MIDLTKLHTKLLLELLQGFRSWSPWDWSGEDKDCSPEDDFGCTEEDLRAELATREHIPNKKEGKKLRQLAAKEGKRNGKVFTKVPRGTHRT